ncbi:hypothetical protein KIPB_015970, partial [Kipferlia bialata]|eukprot:g15970.t1
MARDTMRDALDQKRIFEEENQELLSIQNELLDTIQQLTDK